MIKTLLVLTGAVLLAVPAVHAQQHRYLGARPSALERDRDLRGRGYGYNGRHYHGRYYYYGGIPYFYPFDDFAFGFGYPGYYGGGFGGPYGGYGGYGYGGPGYPGVYEGRITNEDGSDRDGSNHDGSDRGNGPSLPQAVQRQLAKKGYYKGSIDGEFGPASRSALSRFQREHNLKDTGRIDEPTLDALGFTDRAPN